MTGVCYLGFGDGIELGSLHFTGMRLVVTAGLVRVLVRREFMRGGFIGLDRLVVLWAVWACISSVFHEDTSRELIFRLGKSYDTCGLYFLIRSFCTAFVDLKYLLRATAIVLLPIAAGMLLEHAIMRNPFASVANVPETPLVRDGRIRAFGPFAHPILAGTAGAVGIPLMVGLWGYSRGAALLGGLACLAMVGASGSSGPIMSVVAGIVALSFWPFRKRMRAVRWAAVASYIVLDAVMKAPAYYLIARVDLTGSSTGWHRAALIESSLAHLNEWWFAGTDYTLHWMPTGVSWSPNHTDITNHYLGMGVMGGLLLMFLFIGMLAIAFAYVGRQARNLRGAQTQDELVLWTLGSALFAHCVTLVSVAYFDQTILFLYLTLGAIGSASTALPDLAGKPVTTGTFVAARKSVVVDFSARSLTV